MKPLLALSLLLSATFAFANNPTPFVNQPLVPASVAPGGSGFTLTVNGTGFVSGSTVNWNGSPRATTFVNQAQLTAAILSTDTASATTASITVSSPAPGGGTSNVVFLPVRQPSSFVSLNTTSFGVGGPPDLIAVGDFNKDGNQDMATFLSNSNNTWVIQILLGNGDGTFANGASYGVQEPGYAILRADVNGDGNLDLLLPGMQQNNQNGLGVMLGNGDGTFQPPTVQGPGCCNSAIGDFNRDGVLDVALSNGQLCVSLGAGNGSFTPLPCQQFNNFNAQQMTTGDFNLDGKLDLAALNPNNRQVGILLGNGDGTFQAPQIVYTFPSNLNFGAISTADLNGDGKLDLAVVDQSDSQVLVLVGNGNGSFHPSASYVVPFNPYYMAFADMNGDGKLDLVVEDDGYLLATVAVLLGNGDGTFQNYAGYGGVAAGSLAVADLNNDGRFDVVAANGSPNSLDILLQDNGSALSFSPNHLNFPLQLLDTVSQPQVINVTNTGATPVSISNVAITPNFLQTGNCATLQPGKSCKVGVFFTPTTTGNLFGNIGFFDNSAGNPQELTLAGVSTIVSLKPSSLDFGNVTVGHISAPQNIVLTNKGNASLTINQIAVAGANAKDFFAASACPGKLSAGASCGIKVYFHPLASGARNAVLNVVDNGGGSPQKVPLTGNGT